MQTSGMGDPFVIVYVESCICRVLHLGCLHWSCMRFWLFCFKRDNRFVNAAVEGLIQQWKLSLFDLSFYCFIDKLMVPIDFFQNLIYPVEVR